MRDAGPASRAEFQEFWARWRQLRDELMTFASGQPSREVLTVALRLREAVEISLMSSAWMVQEVITGASTPESVVAARQDHAEAVELAHALRWNVRGEEPPPSSVYRDVGRDAGGRSLPAGPMPEREPPQADGRSN